MAHKLNTLTHPAVFDKGRILAFCLGKPSEAFGEPYRLFDAGRRIARLPSPPYLFIDRLTNIGAEAWQLKPGSWVEAEYDVPPDAWYFRANRQASMPYCVILEVGLQSCGWLAAYLGSALRSPTDLSFRNLDGRGKLHSEVFPDAGTLRTRVRLTDVSEAGGMILEKFQMEVLQADCTVYEGETTFGFFSAASLAQQVGIRDARERLYVPSPEELARGRRIELVDKPPRTPDDPGGSLGHGLSLPARALRMIDEVAVLVPDGGPHGLGIVRGTAAVDPNAWFFKAHFHQDPVWPGSLGLESFLQLLKVYAVQRWGERLGATHRFEPIASGMEHRWKYRGQIVPRSLQVTVEAVVTHCAEGTAPIVAADGFLSVDGVCIYEMSGLALRLVEAGARGPGG